MDLELELSIDRFKLADEIVSQLDYESIGDILERILEKASTTQVKKLLEQIGEVVAPYIEEHPDD